LNEIKAFRALQCGDTNALGWFIDRYTPYVSSIINNIIGNSMTASDVEEVASDVFLAFWNNSDKIKSHSIKRYLGGIARNKAKNKYREQGREIPLEDDIIIVSDVTPESAVEIQEQDHLVRQAVLSMQHPDREIFLRYYYYYQPVSEMAQEMNMNVSTIKTRLRRGREKLKETLMEGGNFDGSENFRSSELHTR
jgi:RNA polymerase sigma-70 factor (ECF subfamily)